MCTWCGVCVGCVCMCIQCRGVWVEDYGREKGEGGDLHSQCYEFLTVNNQQDTHTHPKHSPVGFCHRTHCTCPELISGLCRLEFECSPSTPETPADTDTHAGWSRWSLILSINTECLFQLVSHRAGKFTHTPKNVSSEFSSANTTLNIEVRS